ncbi:MAG: efflux RND transporter periplasmic adaptor subunit [Rhodomicrobium sp.]
MRLKPEEFGRSSILSRGRAFSTLFLLALGLAACSEAKVAPVQVRPVKAMIVPAPVTERILIYSGVVAPRIESTLGFRVSGKIVERYVNVGDRVGAGQKIARLDETDLKLAENSARAAVASAKTRAAVAKDALRRANSLLPNGFIAKAAVDQRQLEFDSAQAALDAARDQLEQAVNATGYALLLADKDGTVTSVRAEPGQVVAAGQAVVTQALADDFEVSVSVPEREIVKLKPGDNASVALWSAPSVKSEGKIREIARAADAASRTYGVRVTVPTPVPEMRIGMTTSVSFKLRQEAPVITVPLAALIEAGGKTFAFVADPDSETVARRDVVTGGVGEAGVRIKAGLKPGEILVTGGVQFLADGMKVRLAKEMLTAAAEAAVTAER